jgi:hypothetical protein
MGTKKGMGNLEVAARSMKLRRGYMAIIVIAASFGKFPRTNKGAMYRIAISIKFINNIQLFRVLLYMQ